MILEMLVEVVCPYCGVINTFSLTPGRRMVLCDIEEIPGCDEYFMVDWRPVPQVRGVFRLEKVEEHEQVSACVLPQF